MKLANINMQTPKKVLFTTLLATSVAAGASALNTQQKDSFEKQKFETVDKTLTDKFVSVVKNIDGYDTKIIDKFSGNSEKSFAEQNKTLVRFFTGLILSVVGGMVGNLRDEKGKKYIANADTASNLGFASGFILPGFTSCAVFIASIGIILKSLASTLMKK